MASVRYGGDILDTWQRIGSEGSWHPCSQGGQDMEEGHACRGCTQQPCALCSPACLAYITPTSSSELLQATPSSTAPARHLHPMYCMRGHAGSQPEGSPATRDTSRAVGTTLKTMEVRMKLMPRVPRSMMRFRAPVCLDRWKPRSRSCRCLITRLATCLMAAVVICAAQPDLS